MLNQKHHHAFTQTGPWQQLGALTSISRDEGILFLSATYTTISQQPNDNSGLLLAIISIDSSPMQCQTFSFHQNYTCIRQWSYLHKTLICTSSLFEPYTLYCPGNWNAKRISRSGKKATCHSTACTCYLCDTTKIQKSAFKSDFSKKMKVQRRVPY